MLDVLAVFGNQSCTKFGKLLPQLWYNLRSNKILDWSFLVCIAVNVYVEL